MKESELYSTDELILTSNSENSVTITAQFIDGNGDQIAWT